MKFLLFLISILCISSVHLHAQVRLQLRDALTQQPIEAGQLMCPDNTVFPTDRNGFIDLPANYAKDTLLFLSDGYRSLWQKLEGDSSLYSIQLMPFAFVIDPLLVSASRFIQPTSEIAQVVISISERKIQELAAQTTPDVLEKTGQVYVQRSQAGGGSPILRGFEANRILLVVDGVRLNNAIYRGGHLQNALTVDNQNLEQIDVILNAGAVIYGSDAMGGVIHFSTRNPQLNSHKSKIMARFSSANQEKTLHAHTNVGKKNWALIAGLTLSDFGDLATGKKNRNPKYGDWGQFKYIVARTNGLDSFFLNSELHKIVGSGYQQIDGYFKVRLNPQKQNLSHLFNAQFSTSSGVPRSDRLSEVINGQPRFAQWYYGPQNRVLLSYQLENEKKNARFFDKYVLLLATQYLEESRFDRRFGAALLGNRLEQVRIGSAALDFRKALQQHTLRFGGELQFNAVRSSAYALSVENNLRFPLDSRYPSGGSQTGSFAVYISDNLWINKQLLVQAGLRLNQQLLRASFIDTTFYNFPNKEVQLQGFAPTGSLGAIYKIGNKYRWATNMSTGYRFPNVDDIGKVFDSAPGRVILPNPNLKSEYSYAAEISFTRTWNERLRIELSGFYTFLDQAIGFSNSQFEGQDSILYDGVLSQVVYLQNQDRANIQGASLKIEADLTQGFGFFYAHTLTRGTFSNGKPLDHIPPQFGIV